MENFKAIKRRTPPIIFIPVTGSLIEWYIFLFSN
jgi:hypothetical protein